MPSTFLHIRPSTELNNFLFLAYIRTAANPQMRTSIPRDSPAQSTAIPSAGASMPTPATATARRIHPGMRDPSSAAGAAEDSERCCICLMGFVDRTAVGCEHEFCVSSRRWVVVVVFRVGMCVSSRLEPRSGRFATLELSAFRLGCAAFHSCL
jgi:hypothetical protein